MKKINVLSLFDGMSCGQIALKRVGIKVNNYYASEIKKHAIYLTKKHFPNTIHIGDVKKVSYKDNILYTKNGNFEVGKIDLLLGGSPCQDFSSLRFFYKDKYGLEGDKSILFYEYLRILKEVKPTYFLLENVRMKKESKIELDNFLNVEGIFINSSLLSYQNRPRFYWTNIKYDYIEDKHISFQDYKETNAEICNKYIVKKTPSRLIMWNNGEGNNRLGSCKNITNSDKIKCITRKQDRAPNSGLIQYKDFCRFLTQRELELGQTLPIDYTKDLNYTQAQDLIGDGWTIDVIAHILNFINK